jgi:hypothetical protein
MGTSCRIAYEENGIFYSIYIHDDGYVHTTGQFLINMIKMEQVRALILAGDKWSIFTDEYDDTPFETDQCLSGLLSRSFRQGGECVYLFYRQKWLVCTLYRECLEYKENEESEMYTFYPLDEEIEAELKKRK